MIAFDARNPQNPCSETLGLPRNRRKEAGVHQRLELLVVSFEVHLQL